MVPKYPSPGTSRLAHGLDCADRALTKIENVSIGISVTALFTIMVVVFLDATLRYTINRPLTFTSDLVTLYLIAAGIFTIMSSTLRRGGHISVDLFANMLPWRLCNLLIGSTLLLSAIAVGIMTIELCKASWEAWSHNEKQIGVYAWPMWLSFAIVAWSFLMFEVRLLQIGAANLLSAMLNDRVCAISILPEPGNALKEPV
jgi:TRAP-type C4-dicarboxylate transport system permease small subunit